MYYVRYDGARKAKRKCKVENLKKMF